jgi:ankyrin repeat protein
VKHRLKHTNQHIEVTAQAIYDRSNVTPIGAAPSAQCYDEKKHDPSLTQLYRSNSRTSSNSSIGIHVNPLAVSNKTEPYETLKDVLQTNSQTALTSGQLQAFNSQNSISSENQEICLHRKQTDMDAVSRVSEQDSNIPEDSDSRIDKAIQRRQFSANYDDPAVINLCCNKSSLDINGQCDQDIADRKGLSTETASNIIDEHCSITIERSNTDEVHSNLNQTHLQSLSPNLNNHTVENGMTVYNLIDQDTTENGMTANNHIDQDTTENGMTANNHIDQDTTENGMTANNHIDQDTTENGMTANNHIDQDTTEDDMTAYNHIDQDTTASCDPRRSLQLNMDAASQRLIDHTEQRSLQHGHHNCKRGESDSTNQVCLNYKDSTDFKFQLSSANPISCSADDVAQTSEMNEEQQTSSHSEYEVLCVVDHDNGLRDEVDQTAQVILNIAPAGFAKLEPLGFADFLSDVSTKSGRDSGYESPSLNSSYQQLQVVIESDASNNQKRDPTALSCRHKHYSGSSLRLSRQQRNTGLASACSRPSASFTSGCQQRQPGQSGHGYGSLSENFRMEHHGQVYNYSDGNIAEGRSSVDEFESSSTDSLDSDLHYDSCMLLIENEEKLSTDEADWRNDQVTTDLLPQTHNTDRESVLQAVDSRNDLVPDSPGAADKKTRHLPDILVTTVDGRQDPIALTSLPSWAIDDTQQSFGGFNFTSSHSLVSQVTEHADDYNLPAAHFTTGRSSFTESELVRTSTQRPRLESDSSTGTGSSTAMLASSAVSASQLVRALVAHLTTGFSSTNHRFCEIQHIMPRLLEATVSDNQDSRSLENLLRGTSLTIDLLTAACYIGFQETVERLVLDNPLLINQQDSTGATPLAAASAAGNLPTMRWLLRNEADVNIPTGNGRTSLIVACEQLQHNVFWFLTGEADVDLDVDVVDDDSNTALHYVIEKSSNGGRSLLHNVCVDSDAGYVRKIVFASSRNEVNAQDNDGWTPLHLACLMGKLDVVNILMWAGADTDVLDTDGNTPGDLAVLLGHYDIAVTLGHRPYPEDVWFPIDFPFFMNLLND